MSNGSKHRGLGEISRLGKGVFIIAEAALVDATLVAPELASATVPLGLVIAGAGIAL